MSAPGTVCAAAQAVSVPHIAKQQIPRQYRTSHSVYVERWYLTSAAVLSKLSKPSSDPSVSRLRVVQFLIPKSHLSASRLADRTGMSRSRS
eukprot:2853675-Rhodomonas_salina.1